MTEKEKVQAGQLYRPDYDDELTAHRLLARQRTMAYNSLPPTDRLAAEASLKELLGSMGSGVFIVPSFLCDYGYNIHLGNDVFINANCVILDGANVTIGNNVYIAPSVGLHTAGHPMDAARRNKGIEFAHPITIGNNVWIGAGVQILSGVSIGDGSVIGAGSVVVKSIPAGMVACGNPCRVQRLVGPADEANLHTFNG